MAIPIHPNKTGLVFVRNFDEGAMLSIGAEADPNGFITVGGKKIPDPCFKLDVDGDRVPVYFSQPEPIFIKKVFPFITVFREEMSPNMQRWMGVGQLEYKYGIPNTQITLSNGVSGFLDHEYKPQAFPYDIVYTISVWDRYENPVQKILEKVLRAIPPVGRFIVYDSLNLMRSYEYYHEGGIVNLQEVVDPATRARGYAITIRVEGELDLSDPYTTNGVTGVELNLRVKKD